MAGSQEGVSGRQLVLHTSSQQCTDVAPVLNGREASPLHKDTKSFRCELSNHSHRHIETQISPLYTGRHRARFACSGDFDELMMKS